LTKHNLDVNVKCKLMPYWMNTWFFTRNKRQKTNLGNNTPGIIRSRKRHEKETVCFSAKKKDCFFPYAFRFKKRWNEQEQTVGHSQWKTSERV